MSKEETKEKIYEKLAAIEHEQWSHWQRYLHSRLQYTEMTGEDGNRYACYLLDSADYEHWSRQIDTLYSELSEKEKQSDRDQVDRYWHIIEEVAENARREEREKIIHTITDMTDDIAYEDSLHGLTVLRQELEAVNKETWEK